MPVTSFSRCLLHALQVSGFSFLDPPSRKLGLYILFPQPPNTLPVKAPPLGQAKGRQRTKAVRIYHVLLDHSSSDYRGRFFLPRILAVCGFPTAAAALVAAADTSDSLGAGAQENVEKENRIFPFLSLTITRLRAYSFSQN